MVIAGLSDIGRHLAGLLAKEGNEVLVIDRDPAKCCAIAENSEIVAIVGVAGQKATLEEARVRSAYALVAAAGDDSENLMIAMMAKEMGVKRVSPWWIRQSMQRPSNKLELTCRLTRTW